KAKVSFFHTARPIKKDRTSPSDVPGKRIIRESRHERPSKRTCRSSRNPFSKAWRSLQMWFAGVDWADTHHDVFIIDDVGHQITSFRVAHTPEGLGELTHRLAEVSGPQKKE